ncbi:MAG TPA: hypothetical protein VMB50_13465 [Myxococcales bacterium]|nr:hypothetical protein [Myxococcales bacterium]
METPSAAQVGRLLADACERTSIPYALGGALALGVWGFPRATVDVDLDVFVEEPLAGPSFDREYVRSSLTGIVGSEDERLERWRVLLRDVDRGHSTSG